MDSLIPQEDVNDEDIDEAIMGPTLEEDVAVEFSKNKYIKLEIELHGD